MKTDMSGGAAVLAAACAVAERRLPVAVTALVPAAENMPSGSAVRPGDVVRHYGGQTSEILNTDAEGRVVLADALAYAATLRPDIVIDVATLTGAASLGLGKRHGALYATDDRLAAALLAAADAAGERLWRLPLVDDYRPSVDSLIADLSNIGRNPATGGGSITAALFLREFAPNVPWAHLDIAGPGRADADEGDVAKGPTGFATRTLARYIETLAGYVA
jgi:leucyl aminopeptidase